jgi:hypothetical protein
MSPTFPRLQPAALRLHVALALVTGIACTANHPVPGGPEPSPLSAYLADHRPRDLRVTTTAGSSLWLHNPMLAGDSLIGDAGRDQPPARRAVALADIRALEAPKFSAGRTLGLIGGIVGTAAVAVLILSSGNEAVY